MAHAPQELNFPDPDQKGPYRIEGQVQGKAGHILSKVLETGEPFFILRAKDIFTPMVIREYLRLIEQYSPEDHEFQQDLVQVLTNIRNWQKSNIGLIRYPD